MGFETTTPAGCLSVKSAKEDGLDNYSLLVANKTMPQAYEALKGSADVFLYPGHVNAITGTRLCEALTEEGVSGVVAGMFVIDITADPMVKRQMQRLKEEQISVIVKSVDSCITLQRLTTLFGVPDSMLKILPSADNDLYEKETAPLQDVSASTIHDGSFFGTARLLLEARSIKRAATTGLLLQVIAVILGLSICIGYILVNGYDNITSQTLLFFQLVMTGLTLLTTRLK